MSLKAADSVNSNGSSKPFRLHATLNKIDYHQQRNLSRRQVAELGECHWIQHTQPVGSGPIGSGKSFAISAVGHAACLLAFSVHYARVPTLLMMLEQAKATGTYAKVLQRLSTVDLLIVDDWGLQPLNVVERHDLLELLDRRYQRSSTGFASQLPVNQWHHAIET